MVDLHAGKFHHTVKKDHPAINCMSLKSMLKFHVSSTSHSLETIMKTMDEKDELQNLLHILTAYSLRPDLQEERLIAREFFFVVTGKVHEDDPNYENRMACFQEFFMFDFRLSNVFSGSTVFETFLFNTTKTLPLKKTQSFEHLRNQVHSIFQVMEIKPQGMILKDLFSSRYYDVTALSFVTFTGLNAGQLLDTRLFEFKGCFYFTGIFILHEHNVQRFVEEKIKKFLQKPKHCENRLKTTWEKILEHRNQLFAVYTKKKLELNQKTHRKSIEYLNITKKIVDLPKEAENENLTMALGNENYVNPYVPETTFYSVIPLIHRFAFSEVRCYRYQHVEPLKIYELENRKTLEKLEEKKWQVATTKAKG